MADARRRTIKAVYKDPRTGFGSIAQTLQQAQARVPTVMQSLEEFHRWPCSNSIQTMERTGGAAISEENVRFLKTGDLGALKENLFQNHKRGNAQGTCSPQLVHAEILPIAVAWSEARAVAHK